MELERAPTIPDRHWERYVLVVRDGLPHGEAARRLGVSQGAVAASVLRVQAQLASWRRERDAAASGSGGRTSG